MDPKLLFEDNHLIVLSKPAGLLSQGEKQGDPNLVDWLRGYLGRNYVGLVHRLDRNTSGLMVVAKRTKAARRLTEALQQGDLDRRYLAWVVGKLAAPATWEHWLLKDENTNKTRVFRDWETHPAGTKVAKLKASPIRTAVYQSQPVTLVEFVLETGRSHQIRAQAAAEGLPLVGDTKYGRPGDPRFARPALHSHRMSFPHPMSEEMMTYEDPLPTDLFEIGDQPTR